MNSVCEKIVFTMSFILFFNFIFLFLCYMVVDSRNNFYGQLRIEDNAFKFETRFTENKYLLFS